MNVNKRSIRIWIILLTDYPKTDRIGGMKKSVVGTWQSVVQRMKRDAEKESLKAVAERIGIPYATAWRLLNTERSVTTKTMGRVAQYYAR